MISINKNGWLFSREKKNNKFAEISKLIDKQQQEVAGKLAVLSVNYISMQLTLEYLIKEFREEGKIKEKTVKAAEETLVKIGVDKILLGEEQNG